MLVEGCWMVRESWRLHFKQPGQPLNKCLSPTISTRDVSSLLTFPCLICGTGLKVLYAPMDGQAF